MTRVQRSFATLAVAAISLSLAGCPGEGSDCSTGTGTLAIENTAETPIEVTILDDRGFLDRVTMDPGSTYEEILPVGPYRVEAEGSNIGAPLHDSSHAVRCGDATTVTVQPLPRFTLTTTISGSGGGRVTSDPPAINCDKGAGDCESEFEKGTDVTLAASPDMGSRFLGWSGACSGSGSCTVKMNQSRDVGAQFTPTVHDFTVALSGTGRGTVTSTPGAINCGNSANSPAADCSADFEYGTEITLTATPAVGSVFGGWDSEDCDNSSLTCTTTVFMAETITTEFILTTRTLTVTKNGDGQGTVTASTGAIDCGATCTAEYEFCATITLTANAAMHSEFAGWSGSCTGSLSTCEVSLAQAAEVTAQFNVVDYSIAVILAGDGSGSVSSSPGGIECGTGGSCSANFKYGTSVVLTATPDSGSTFTGWTGDVCATSSPDCVVSSLDQAQSVTATFDVTQLTAPLVTSIGLGEKEQGQVQAQGLSYYIAFAGEAPTGSGDIIQGRPYVGQIMPYPSSLQPSGWLPADGSVLPVSEYPELFDVIGNTYGGDGETNFAVPDLRARVPVGVGTIADATIPAPGEGNSVVPLISSMALGEVSQGEFEALGVNFMIAREGNYPQQDGADTSSPLIGEIRMLAGDTIPSGWVACDGSTLPINSQNIALYSVLGTTYGGDGQAYFNLPDFRARAPMHVGEIDVESPPDWTEKQIPLIESMERADVARGQIGTIGIRIGVARTGLYPSTGGDDAAPATLIGQTLMFGGLFMPGGWYPTDGDWYYVDDMGFNDMGFNIDDEPGLYSILGKSFGYRPSGILEEFRLPDLRARLPVGKGSR